MGPSRCGKTALLNCLSGLDTIDAGDVPVEGVSLASMPDRERTDYCAAHVGFVFQFYSLVSVLNAVDALDLVGLAHRASTSPMNSRVANGSASRSHHRW